MMAFALFLTLTRFFFIAFFSRRLMKHLLTSSKYSWKPGFWSATLIICLLLWSHSLKEMSFLIVLLTRRNPLLNFMKVFSLSSPSHPFMPPPYPSSFQLLLKLRPSGTVLIPMTPFLLNIELVIKSDLRITRVLASFLGLSGLSSKKKSMMPVQEILLCVLSEFTLYVILFLHLSFDVQLSYFFF